MEKQNVIVVISNNQNTVEVFGNFKKMCEVKQLPYHSLKSKKFPMQHLDILIYKNQVL